MNRIYDFSDGGGKHFKLSYLMLYMSRKYATSYQIYQYLFFPSYHGPHASDAAAKHANEVVLNHEKETKRPLGTLEAAMGILKKNPKNRVSFAPYVLYNHAVPTLVGISECHWFTFPAPGVIHGYLKFGDEEPLYVWHRSLDKEK